jgi:methionyl-tRNA formyltransferase
MGIRIAIFGQAPFGRDVAVRLAEAGHDLVGVHVPPEKGRPDPLATEAEARGWPLFRYKTYRRKGEAKPEIVEEFQTIGAELNVLPFTTAILPPEIVDAPRLGSLCFHPSLLPAYRGGNALAWQVILGARESGVTVFRPDDGVDTGPIVIQRGGVPIGPEDTGASYYFDHLYAMGVDALADAVAQVAEGRAEFVAQAELGASFQGLVDDVAARIDWTRPGEELDRLVRGCDPQPGALADLDGVPVRLYGEKLEHTAHGAQPGTILEPDPDAGRLRVAAAGDCVLTLAKLKLGDAKTRPALEARVAPGQCLG